MQARSITTPGAARREGRGSARSSSGSWSTCCGHGPAKACSTSAAAPAGSAVGSPARPACGSPASIPMRNGSPSRSRCRGREALRRRARRAAAARRPCARQAAHGMFGCGCSGLSRTQLSTTSPCSRSWCTACPGSVDIAVRHHVEQVGRDPALGQTGRQFVDPLRRDLIAHGAHQRHHRIQGVRRGEEARDQCVEHRLLARHRLRRVRFVGCTARRR